MNEQPRGGTGEPSGDAEGPEGGKTARGAVTGTRSQLDGASGGYGSESGAASSGGTGEGEPVADEPGQPADATGAAGEAPTDWLRRG
jgi:hypothetical protein